MKNEVTGRTSIQRQVFLMMILMLNCMLLLVAATVSAETLTMATGDWLPYLALVGNDPPGYANEIIKTLVERAGHTVSIRDIPYARAVNMLQNGGLDLLVMTQVDAPDPEKVVIIDEEIGMIIYAFYVTTATSWKYSGLQSLSTMQLGVVIGETYPGLESYLASAEHAKMIQFIGGQDGYQRNLKKLIEGRVNVIVENDNVIQYYANRMGITEQIQQVGFLSKPAKLVVGVTKNRPQAEYYAAILSEGIKQMRISGELQQLLTRYGLTDWK